MNHTNPQVREWVHCIGILLFAGPPGSTWSGFGTTFSSTVTGWYSIGYKIDLNVAGTTPGGEVIFGSILLLNGSGTIAQAPTGANHVYALTNYIIFPYTAGNILSLNVITAAIIPGMSVGIAKPAGGNWATFVEATATMTISQISN